MDNSTDPPFKEITFEEFEAEYGVIEKLTPKEALYALEDLNQTHWLPADETDAVRKALAAQAGILDNLEELENLGLEHLYLPDPGDSPKRSR